MPDWKRALVAGSAGASVILLLKGRTAAGLLVAGAGIATLASEYPEKFAEVRDHLPDYAERGTRYLELISRIVERIGRQVGRRNSPWYQGLLEG